MANIAIGWSSTTSRSLLLSSTPFSIFFQSRVPTFCPLSFVLRFGFALFQVEDFLTIVGLDSRQHSSTAGSATSDASSLA